MQSGIDTATPKLRAPLEDVDMSLSAPTSNVNACYSNGHTYSSVYLKAPFLTKCQIARLEAEFSEKNNLSSLKCEELVRELDLPASTVKSWFTKRRSKDKLKIIYVFLII